MEMKQIRIDTPIKVKSILENLNGKNVAGLLWQHEDNVFERHSVDAKMVKLDEIHEHIYLTPIKAMFCFDRAENIFYLNENKSILFKTKIYLNSTYKLILQYPKEIMLREQRRFSRTQLSHKDIYMHFHYGEHIGGVLERFPFRSKVLDFSDGGLSFTTRLASAKHFSRGDKITIKLNNKNQDVVAAKICYVKPMLEVSHDSFRVGVSFN